ncbi:MAG: hypothetical protein ABI876_13885, partial [Bacteroidota bacterium]
MNYIEHTIELRGPACGGRYIDSAMIGALLNRISPLVRGSILMAVLRSSHKSGRPLKELRSACNVEFGGQQAGEHGSTRLDFIAPTLEDAAPRLFEQRSLFEDIAAPDDTGFDLVGKMLSDVTRGNRESERYDSRLLNDLARFGT